MFTFVGCWRASILGDCPANLEPLSRRGRSPAFSRATPNKNPARSIVDGAGLFERWLARPNQMVFSFDLPSQTVETEQHIDRVCHPSESETKAEQWKQYMERLQMAKLNASLIVGGKALGTLHCGYIRQIQTVMDGKSL